MKPKTAFRFLITTSPDTYVITEFPGPVLVLMSFLTIATLLCACMASTWDGVHVEYKFDT